MPLRAIRITLAVTTPVLASLLLILASYNAQADAASQPITPASPGDWPMFGHDVSRTNFNPAETTLSRDNVDQITPRWQAYIGRGSSPSFSFPTVANGRVFVGSSVTSGNNYFAFDASTGSPLWSANIGHGADVCFGVGIGSTAAVSGTILAVGGGDSAYYGLDAATGTILWRHDLNAGPSGFAWTSPLPAFDRFYVGIASDCDNPSVPGEVRALRADNGAQLASRFFVPKGEAGAGVWNSPALSPDGSTLVVTTGEDYDDYDGPYNRALISLDPAELDILQADQQGPEEEDMDWASTPIIFSDSPGRTLVGAAHKDGNFYAYDLAHIEDGPIWQLRTDGPTGFMAAYDPTYGDGGTLFVARARGLYALDPGTGAVRWYVDTSGPFVGGFVVANGLIYANFYDVLAIMDERDGTVLRTLVPASGGSGGTGPVVANGVLYWAAGNYLNAWSLPSGTPTPGVCTLPFSDVSNDDYFYQAVLNLYCSGAISGYSDNTFRPYSNTTRGQLSKLIVLAEQWPLDTTNGPHFIDVDTDNPFYSFIETAYNRGVISGYSDQTFRWGSDITRGQLTKIIALAQDWELDTYGGPHFTDVPSTDPFYAFIETAYNQGVISGYSDQTFRPGTSATRGQICKITYNALSNGQ